MENKVLKEIKEHKDSLNSLKELIGVDGCVAFEHGYRKPTFTFEGYKYRCSMVTNKAAYCQKKYADGQYRCANMLLMYFPKKILDKLYKEVNKYIEYCKNEA